MDWFAVEIEMRVKDMRRSSLFVKVILLKIESFKKRG
jgi:hypothetical protein